jgi:hypothetical protein
MFENPHNPLYHEYLNSSRYFAGFGSMEAILSRKGRPRHSFQIPIWLYDNHLSRGTVEDSWSDSVLIESTTPLGTISLSNGRKSKIETLKQRMLALAYETPFELEYMKGNVSLIASLDEQHLRANLLDIFNKDSIHVDCPGSVGHNIDDPLFGPYWEQKILFISERLFNICPESGFSPGYVTEKLWQAAIAPSIPIYWGSLNSFDKQIFYTKRIIFVDMKNTTDVKRVAKFVYQLLENPEMLSSFYKQPTYQPGAWFAIQRRLREWNTFVVSIIKHALLRQNATN